MENIFAAKKEHLGELIEMGVDLWKEDYTAEKLKSIFSDILNSNKYKVLLYSLNEIIAAFIMLSIRTDYVEGSESSPTGYIEGIYVKQEFRKGGIAKKLFIEGEKWLKEKGCKQVGSDAYIDNKVSYDFHTAIGFKEAGKLVAFIKDTEQGREREYLDKTEMNLVPKAGLEPAPGVSQTGF